MDGQANNRNLFSGMAGAVCFLAFPYPEGLGHAPLEIGKGATSL